MRRPIYFFIIAFFYFSNAIIAQNTGKVSSDSINTVSLKNFSKNLADIETQRIADSIRKAELEAQILALKTTDNLKKEELQNQLKVLISQDSIRIAEKKVRIDSMRLTVKSYPVNGFFSDTLFMVFGKLGSFSAHDRAEAICNRIKKLTSVRGFKTDSLIIAEAETTIDLIFGETIITSISENDALWNNTSKEELATRYQRIIGDSVMTYQSSTSLITLAKNISLAIFVLLVTYILIRYLLKFFTWTAVLIYSQEGKLIQGIKIKNYTLFDTKSQVSALLSVNTLLKWLFLFILVYIALPLLFGIFPWTENFAGKLLGYIVNPAKSMALSVWNYLPNLITIIVIVIIFRYVLKGMHFLKIEIERGNLHLSGFYPDWASPTYQILKVVVYAFMLIVIFPYLPGSDSPVFQGVSVFLGVLFTFGSSGSLSNLVAGLVLTYMRLFKIGDRVKIGDVVGDVIEKSLLVTRIRTIKNEIISIPNSTVMSSHTINYSSDTVDKGLILHTTVTIGYDVPWKTIHQALIDAADRTDLLLKDPKPFVLQTSLEDFYVAYQINAYTKEANKQALIYSNLHTNIQDCCNEVGIEILSPHYRAARDGNASTIPADYLGKDYEVPSFNVHVKPEKKQK